ncbi:MAG: acyltransferase family protein [Sphingorhabdus sp.]
MNPDHQVQRHIGLDWLRIGAFAILIFYHSAMYFGPFHWVLKASHPADWLAYPLTAISPWRLMVLFAVSGYATAAMIAKSGPGRFFGERSKRLLIPLFFGIAVIVPPQSWVRLATENIYTGSFTAFWLNDYFRFGPYSGHTLPHWEHLWFLGYLWGYTAVLAGFIALAPDWRRYAMVAGNWLGHGYRLVLIPAAAMIIFRLLMIKEGMANHGMFDDFIGDAHYIPAFLFGFLLARNPLLWDAVRRCWRLALAGSVTSYAVLAYALSAGSTDGNLPTWLHLAETVADSAMAWMMVPVAFQMAHILLNRDHPWRAILAEAVFPAYLVHQTVIVLFGWYLLRFDLSNIIGFTLIAAAVIVTSAAAYGLAKKVRWLGPLLGVAAKSDRSPAAKAVAGTYVTSASCLNVKGSRNADHSQPPRDGQR